jgi:hypothetical protein
MGHAADCSLAAIPASQAHGSDASGQVVFRKMLRRPKVPDCFGQMPRCTTDRSAFRLSSAFE